MANVRTDYAIGIKDDTQRGITSVQRRLASLGRSFASFAPAISVAGIAAFVGSAAKAADALNDMSKRLGVSVEDLSRLDAVARQSGLSIEGLGSAMQIAARNIAEASRGMGTANDALRELNLDAVELKQLRPDQQLLAIARAFEHVGNESERLRLVRDIFGRGGAEMLQLFADGVDEIASSMAAVEPISGEAARNIDWLGDRLAVATVTARNFSAEITGKLIGGLRDLVGTGFSEWALKAELAFQKLNQQALRFNLWRAKFQGGLADEAAKQWAAQFEEGRRAIDDLAAGIKILNTTAHVDKPLLILDLRAFEDASRELDKIIEKASDKERDNIMTQLERDARAASKAIEDTIREMDDFLSAKEAIRERNRTPFEDYLQDLAEVRAALDETGEDQALFAREYARLGEQLKSDVAAIIPDLEEIGDTTQDATSAVRELGLTFSSAFEDALVGGKKFSGILRGIEQDILRIVTRKLVTEPLADMFTGMFGGGGGSGSGIGSFFSRLFGGARAGGGPVESGRAYLVGERGPEVFMPRQSGQVLAGAGGITINVHGVRDADSFMRSRSQIATAAQFALARAGARNG